MYLCIIISGNQKRCHIILVTVFVLYTIDDNRFAYNQCSYIPQQTDYIYETKYTNGEMLYI